MKASLCFVFFMFSASRFFMKTCALQLQIHDFHYSRKYANTRRIVRILLVQLGKGPLKVLCTYLIALSGIFPLLQHAINLTWFWDNWQFIFSRMDTGSSRAPQEAKKGFFRWTNTWKWDTLYSREYQIMRLPNRRSTSRVFENARAGGRGFLKIQEIT